MGTLKLLVDIVVWAGIAFIAVSLFRRGTGRRYGDDTE